MVVLEARFPLLDLDLVGFQSRRICSVSLRLRRQSDLRIINIIDPMIIEWHRQRNVVLGALVHPLVYQGTASGLELR